MPEIDLVAVGEDELEALRRAEHGRDLDRIFDVDVGHSPAPFDFLARPRARIVGVAHAVAEEVEREHRRRDREAGKDRQPPARRQVIAIVREHGPPLRARGLGAEPEETQARRLEDRGRDPERRDDDQGTEGVGQDPAEQDREPASAEGAAREDELALSEGEDLGAHLPREARDLADPDGDHDLPGASPEHGDDEEREEDRGEREQDVDPGHEDRVPDARLPAGDSSDRDPEDSRRSRPRRGRSAARRAPRRRRWSRRLGPCCRSRTSGATRAPGVPSASSRSPSAGASPRAAPQYGGERERRR